MSDKNKQSATQQEPVELVRSGEGELGPLSELFTQGFSETKTIKAGDPSSGNVPAYIGLLLSESDPVLVDAPDSTKDNPKKNEIRTFLMNPVDTKTMKPNRMVTHKVICPAQLATDFSAFLGDAVKAKKDVIAGYMFEGKQPIKGGKQTINRFRVLHKFVDASASA